MVVGGSCKVGCLKDESGEEMVGSVGVLSMGVLVMGVTLIKGLVHQLTNDPYCSDAFQMNSRSIESTCEVWRIQSLCLACATDGDCETNRVMDEISEIVDITKTSSLPGPLLYMFTLLPVHWGPITVSSSSPVRKTYPLGSFFHRGIPPHVCVYIQTFVQKHICKTVSAFVPATIF